MDGKKFFWIKLQMISTFNYQMAKIKIVQPAPGLTDHVCQTPNNHYQMKNLVRNLNVYSKF